MTRGDEGVHLWRKLFAMLKDAMTPCAQSDKEGARERLISSM
jgi:hypothetical protein